MKVAREFDWIGLMWLICAVVLYASLATGCKDRAQGRPCVSKRVDLVMVSMKPLTYNPIVVCKKYLLEP